MGLNARLDLRGALVLAVIGLLLSACAKQSGGSEPTYRSQNPEKPYSATPINYAAHGPVTIINAVAKYQYYDDMSGANTGLASMGTPKPIRYAEVHILDAAGNQIQQGETDGSGNISLAIPRTAGSYTLRVNSRADNSQYKASVLMDPYDTQYYSLDTAFSLAGSETSSTVTISPAPASNSTSVMGGAFSILDQILVANDFLRSNAYSASCPVCSNDFSVAPKIQIFWQKGLTPAAYYGSPQSPISFFLAESGAGMYRGIYILGGIEGDVCTDTDHFDRSVILHEYGHFLENAFGKSSSPGGAHDGNSQIDPRLAWSEGWADFFQAAALGRQVYRDTKRNGGCAPTGMGMTAQLSFPDFNMEIKNVDQPSPNEGIFREISIARTLYDVMTVDGVGAASDTYGAGMEFAPIWHAFKTIGGASFAFQNMGQVNQSLSSIATANYDSTTQSNLAGLFSYERQVTDQAQYAQPRTLKSGTCTVTFAQGSVNPDSRDSDGYIIETDMLASNDYFRYDYDGNAANAVLILRYRRTGGSITTPFDLDVYVYNEKHVLLDPADIVLYSEAVYPEPGGNGTYPGYEYINFTGLPAGRYLINVKPYYLTNKGDTTYFFESPSGAQLCP